MSRLTDLIAQVKARDQMLGTDLDREFKVLSSRLPFGLNFERHSPEVIQLPLRPVRKGDKVRLLVERGSRKKDDPRLWRVKAIKKTDESTLADLELLGSKTPVTLSTAIADLVVVAQFRDTIYPGMVSTGVVRRSGGRSFNTVVNGETTMS